MGDTCQECGEAMEADDDWVCLCTDFVNGSDETLPIGIGWYHAVCLPLDSEFDPDQVNPYGYTW
jgi:hypothetical protein